MEGNTNEEKIRIPDEAEIQIINFVNMDPPPSFFLFAGAGSGKTGTLVEVLKSLQQIFGARMQLKGQQIGVITYTNAACDEIINRLEYDPLFDVLTIHSFVWSLIHNFHYDIKKWLDVELRKKIDIIKEEYSRGKAGSKAQNNRPKEIKATERRLERLKEIKEFTYSPNGDYKGIDGLNHSEVIKIGTYFLDNKPLMQNILINRFPILLIDECQDTNKDLMEALMRIQKKYSKLFCLGLFGDMMQRIYTDGKDDLEQIIPTDWKKPAKTINYRSPPRIIELINQIRSGDGVVQKPKAHCHEKGVVRMFILPSTTPDKSAAENQIAQKMAEITGDHDWFGPNASVKKLVLEHHMAARRLGFFELFMPLYLVDSLKTGLMNKDISLPGLSLFSRVVWPLIQAKQQGKEFSVMAIVRKYSPLLTNNAFQQAGRDQLEQIKKVREAVDLLMNLYEEKSDLPFIDVLNCVGNTGLFVIPDSLAPWIGQTLNKLQIENVQDDQSQETSPVDEEREGWRKFLLAPFRQIEPFIAYISGESDFDTHHGVKGREFPRVMVVIDDYEARGFMHKFENLFSGKGSDSTRRLFYVTCSRAMSSLAIINYTNAADANKKYIIHSEEWFTEEEVIDVAM